MKKYIAIAFILGTLSFACNRQVKPANSNARPVASAEVKKGVAPVADPEMAVVEMENPAYGSIKIELYSNIAPKMVARFKQLAQDGYYDGIIYHRVNDNVIQAGNSDTKPGRSPNPAKEGDSGLPDIEAEFSDVPFDTGIVGAARLGSSVNSQNAQFFIMLKRQAAFDNNYTIFGKVIEGMNNVRTIAGAPRDGEKPTDPIRIKHISIVPRDQAK
ncbi:MAG: peptidylprolyl isomerase [Acidobacteria bacterium]|nr:peptidylprolyl isomerase [Acidobacteriota bacterium]